MDSERARRLARLKQWKTKETAEKKSTAAIEPITVKLGSNRKHRSRLVLESSTKSRKLETSSTLPDSAQESDLLDSFMQKLDSVAPVAPGFAIEDDIDEFSAELPATQPLRHQPRTKEIPTVNHAEITYEPFKSVFYTNTDPVETEGITASRPLAPIWKWESGGFSRPIIEYIYNRHFENPTPVQSVAAAAILSGNDVMAIAQTGSGKTLAFVLPMLRHVQAQISSPSDGPIATVLAPTRELCAQIYAETLPLAQAVGLGVCCAYGGSDIKPQIDQLMRGNVHIVIATPGRLIDLLAANKGRVLSTRKTSMVVVDEADRMFDLGFSPQIYRILRVIRPDNQTVLCSATFSPSMRELANKILKDPVVIQVGENSKVGSHIYQEFELLDPLIKLNRLVEVLGTISPPQQAIVFVDRQELADDIASQLLFKGYKCTSLHGGKPQNERDNSIQEFRQGLLDVLVATSVAARGIDVRTVSLVVNFDPPNHLEDYVHRVGRTGRAGQSGRAVTFFSPGQYKQAYEVSRAYKTMPKEIMALASDYKERKYDREGFGGKGLSKLGQSRDQERAASLGILTGESTIKKPKVEKTTTGYSTILEFNDFVPQARKQLMNLGKQSRISEEYNISLTIKGQYNKFGDKLRMVIEGTVKAAVLNAYDEFAQLLIEGSQEAQASSARYQV